MLNTLREERSTLEEQSFILSDQQEEKLKKIYEQEEVSAGILSKTYSISCNGKWCVIGFFLLSRCCRFYTHIRKGPFWVYHDLFLVLFMQTISLLKSNVSKLESQILTMRTDLEESQKENIR